MSCPSHHHQSPGSLYGSAFGTVKVTQGFFQLAWDLGEVFRGSQFCFAWLSKINHVTFLKILGGQQPPESASTACSRFLDQAVREMRSPGSVCLEALESPWLSPCFLQDTRARVWIRTCLSGPARSPQHAPLPRLLLHLCLGRRCQLQAEHHRLPWVPGEGGRVRGLSPEQPPSLPAGGPGEEE